MNSGSFKKYLQTKQSIDLMSRVFANDPGDQGLIPGRVISKTQKMVLDATFLNTQYYKVRIKGKEEQSREWRSAIPYTLKLLAIEKGAFGSPSTKVTNFTFHLKIMWIRFGIK